MIQPLRVPLLLSSPVLWTGTAPAGRWIPSHLRGIITACREMGLRTAIDDLGAGFAKLVLLAKFRRDAISFDMDLLRGIGTVRVRRRPAFETPPPIMAWAMAG
jgi:hypothetical protein